MPFFFFKTAHMWFDDKIVEADTTEDQSGHTMVQVIKKNCSDDLIMSVQYTMYT